MARASMRTRECCCATPLQRCQKTELFHQLSGVTGPAFRHRSAQKHADAAGAVHGRNGTDAAARAVGGVPVLHVMAERAMVHNVIQLDHAVDSRRAAGACILRR